MRRVELIYNSDCPHVEATRAQLRRALEKIGQSANWIEWNRSDPASPPHARRYGSPTILIDGVGIGGPAEDDANCCRVYEGEDGRLHGVPPLSSIVTALQGATRRPAPRTWLATVPAVGVSLLPNLTCPACWPAYAGLLSSLGLGFLVHSSYLLPLTSAFLVLAVSLLGVQARKRRQYGPLAVGVVAAAATLGGKFALESTAAMYAGIALLIGASLWNSRSKRKAGVSYLCTSTETLYQIESHRVAGESPD